MVSVPFRRACQGIFVFSMVTLGGISLAVVWRVSGKVDYAGLFANILEQ